MIILPIERNSTEAKILHVKIRAPAQFHQDDCHDDHNDHDNDDDDNDDDDDDDDETNGETWGHGIGRPSTPVMLVTPHRPQHGDDDDYDDTDDNDDDDDDNGDDDILYYILSFLFHASR